MSARGDVGRRAALVPEQGERRVGEGEARVDRDGLPERRIGAGLHPQHPAEPDVVGVRRGRLVVSGRPMRSDDRPFRDACTRGVWADRVAEVGGPGRGASTRGGWVAGIAGGVVDDHSAALRSADFASLCDRMTLWTLVHQTRRRSGVSESTKGTGRRERGGRGDLGRDGVGDGDGLRPDLGNGGRLPELATAQRAQGPHGTHGTVGRAYPALGVGREPHAQRPGRRVAGREQRRQQRVATERDIGLLARCS